MLVIIMVIMRLILGLMLCLTGGNREEGRYRYLFSGTWKEILKIERRKNSKQLCLVEPIA